MGIDPQSKSGLKPLTISAVEDIVGGALRWELWGRLGWLEVKRRYRRTTLGPFWSSLTLLVFVIVMGSVGSGLLSRNTSEYLPFLVSGMLAWTMLSSMIGEAGGVFVAGAGLIRQMNFEQSILAYALVWRNFIAFLHNMIVYLLIILVYMPHALTWKVAFAIPGLMLLMVNGVWITIVLGTLTARFRDVQQIVQSIIQVSMFVTPLFWSPDNLSGTRRVVFVGLNPLYHLLSIVRDPLLGRMPSLNSYIAVAIITLVGWTFAFVVYSRFRKRIAYWL
ncbi:ABC transporter permease [Bradyrhizobium sp.]|uniref:ABC transporter permease n=1 Tax=Bradyrhizobium sp. TaxID=376 RepID=UPI003C3AAA28